MKQITVVLFLIFTTTAVAQEKKQDFQPVNTSFILEKIAKTNPGTWSLSKNSDVRHYGITDEEFFTNFGNDRKGKIGATEKVPNTDKIGLNYTAIHALIKENKELKKDLETMEENLKSYEESFFELQENYTNLLKNLDKIQKAADMEQVVKEMEMRITDLEEKIEELEK